jgi:hypothetical protein
VALKKQKSQNLVGAMDFRKIIYIIGRAAQKRETVEIYYPKTEHHKAGWREVEPYSLTNDIAPNGEHLVWGKDLLSPGHILNAYPVDSSSKHCYSFILGKIRAARFTHKKFQARYNWKIEF